MRLSLAPGLQPLAHAVISQTLEDTSDAVRVKGDNGASAKPLSCQSSKIRWQDPRYFATDVAEPSMRFEREVGSWGRVRRLTPALR